MGPGEMRRDGLSTTFNGGRTGGAPSGFVEGQPLYEEFCGSILDSALGFLKRMAHSPV